MFLVQRSRFTWLHAIDPYRQNPATPGRSLPTTCAAMGLKFPPDGHPYFSLEYWESKQQDEDRFQRLRSLFRWN